MALVVGENSKEKQPYDLKIAILRKLSYIGTNVTELDEKR